MFVRPLLVITTYTQNKNATNILNVHWHKINQNLQYKLSINQNLQYKLLENV